MAGPTTQPSLGPLLPVPAALWLLVVTSRLHESVAQGSFSDISDWEALPSDQPGNGSLVYWERKERNRYHWWTACEAKPHRQPPSAGPFVSGYCPKAVGDCLLGRHGAHKGGDAAAALPPKLPMLPPAPATASPAVASPVVASPAIASPAIAAPAPLPATSLLNSSACIGAFCCVMHPHNPQCQPTLPHGAKRRRLDPQSSGTVLVQFEGRLGNNLIQLAAGYVLANALGGYKVEVSEPSKVNGWLNKKVPGRSNSGCRQFDVKISDKDSRSKNTVSHQFTHALKVRPKCIELDGYFQDYGLFRGHRDELRNLLAPSQAACNKPLANPPKDDEFVFHIRDASLKQTSATNKSALPLKPPHHSGYIGPPSEYYHRVIRGAFAAGAKSLTVIVDPAMNTATSVVNLLLVKTYGARIPKGHSVNEDLCYVTKAKRLAINGGTFGWIGAFLGSAHEVSKAAAKCPEEVPSSFSFFLLLLRIVADDSLRFVQVHYPLSGLLDHERSLNYPGGYCKSRRRHSAYFALADRCACIAHALAAIDCVLLPLCSTQGRGHEKPAMAGACIARNSSPGPREAACRRAEERACSWTTRVGGFMISEAISTAARGDGLGSIAVL